jgi:hypothetical protein
MVRGSKRGYFWTPIVKVWNKIKPPSASEAENIAAVIVTKTTSLRCLTALANAASTLLQVDELNDSNRNNIF